MKDVARLAGVSTSTVSHVVNNNRFVSDSVRDKVMAAVEQLNYAPSALARSLKLNQTRTIGMLVRHRKNAAAILCNTEDAARMNRSMETFAKARRRFAADVHRKPPAIARCPEPLPVTADRHDGLGAVRGRQRHYSG